MTRPVDPDERVAAGLDHIAELVRRTTQQQGLPEQLEDPAIARQAAAILVASGRCAATPLSKTGGHAA